jgi:predicted nucleic acid-binding protein
MMKPTVYIETTIPSYYFDERADLLRDIQRTRQWWDSEREEYECMISPMVLRELEQGDYPYQEQCLELVSDIPVLEVNEEIEEIVEVYLAHHLMPRHPAADAVHLAFASYYRIDYLLTWNCKHLANARKEGHLKRINERLGLYLPRLVTPQTLQLTEDQR